MDIILTILLPAFLGFGLATIVMAIFETRREANRFRKQLDALNNQATQLELALMDYQRLIQDSQRDMFQHIDEIKRQIDEIYRYVDSRHDKLENKLTETIKNGCEPVKSK
jgi:predicted  nucleic acid-binding Zn-ribbon protein